jgi:membrane-bound lytic murein transglycosylase D
MTLVRIFHAFGIMIFALQISAQAQLKDSPEQQLYSKGTNISNIPSDQSNALTSELVYEFYLESLNQNSPLDLEYNSEVKKTIDYFLVNRKKDIEVYLGRSQYYFPIIEQILDKYNLPLELKFVAVIESGLNPIAVSKSGAVGLWQFLYNTCSLFNLKVDSYIDERRDPTIATEAACKYFQYLYNTFHDWNLVLASYNGGPGEVRKAIERSGGITDYWKLRPYLSKQAADYIPSFIALAYLMNYNDKYGMFPEKNKISKESIDTIMINYQLSFSQISEVIDIPVTEIKALNPVYKRDYIPKGSVSNKLILPESKIKDFLRYEREIIYHKPSIKSNYLTQVENAGSTENRKKIEHTVLPGEYFHKIAIQYNCTIEDIKVWNKLDSLSLHPGQVLTIWLPIDISL